MRLIPASRHMSTWRRAWSTSVDPTWANPPRPPNVIVPMVSTETLRPDFPSVRYSIHPTLPTGGGAAAGWCSGDRGERSDGADAGGVAAGKGAVDLRVGVHPLLGPALDLPGHPGRDAHGDHAVGDDQAGRDRGPGRDQGAAPDDRDVEDGG